MTDAERWTAEHDFTRGTEFVNEGAEKLADHVSGKPNGRRLSCAPTRFVCPLCPSRLLQARVRRQVRQSHDFGIGTAARYTRSSPTTRVMCPWPLVSSSKMTAPGPNLRTSPSDTSASISPERQKII